ncbi:MAG: HPP family protein [Myxococcales bacterium]|nr:MAG: HPP family protein [Myxococcales bacterium]
MDKTSLEPIRGASAPARRRLGLRAELGLALLPTATVLIVLGLVQALAQQRLLFGSLASSAFLIYLDPGHGTNQARTLVASHLLAAVLGLATAFVLGHGYPAAAAAMGGSILLMVVLDVVHPPAVSTSLGFAFRTGGESDLTIFALALSVMVVLVGLQRAATWLLARASGARA